MVIATTMGGMTLLLATTTSAYAPPSIQSARMTSSLIVWCDCDTPAKRERIQKNIRRSGGKIFYVYKEMGGFAVAVPASRDRASVEKKLRAISGVHAVQPDQAIKLGEPGGPQ